MPDTAAEKKKGSLHSDHRARMRARVEKYGLDSLAEHEALEFILFLVIPRKDTNPIAHALIEQFGSFANVLDASEEELLTVRGIGPNTAHFLHSLRAIDNYYVMSRNANRIKISTAQDAANCLIPHFRGEKHEKLGMLALDDRSRLLRFIWLDDGSAGALDVSTRKIASAAAISGAASVILAHNHPDDVPLPSREDMLSTQAAMQALAVLDVNLKDHIILAGDEWLSMKDSGRMPHRNPAAGRAGFL